MNPDEEEYRVFSIALQEFRELSKAAVAARFDADREENLILLNSQGKSAEQRKAEAELGSDGTRGVAALAASEAKVAEYRVLFLIAQAKGR